MTTSTDPAPKNCPICNGQMIREESWVGKLSKCIMCGHLHEVIPAPTGPDDISEAKDGLIRASIRLAKADSVRIGIPWPGRPERTETPPDFETALSEMKKALHQLLTRSNRGGYVNTPLTEVSGILPRVVTELEKADIVTVRDLTVAPVSQIAHAIGWGKQILELAQILSAHGYLPEFSLKLADLTEIKQNGLGDISLFDLCLLHRKATKES